MKPPPFVYHRPTSVEEATRLLAELGDEAKVVAGGQSLVPLLNFRLAAPGHLVDVNSVSGLDRLDRADGAIEVGATVRDARLLREPQLAAAHPLLVEATGWIAHPVIRNRGTVCGSLAHADPAAELPAVLALLDGSVEAVAWRRGALTSRRVPAAALFAGPLQTTLEADELVVAATFPTLEAGTGWAVYELARRHGDYALAGVVLTVTVDGDGKPTSGRAAYLSCAPTPVVIDVGPVLADGRAGPDALYDLVASSLDPTDDIHATAEYRRHLAATLTVRALDRTLERARAGTGMSDPPSEVPA
ncbi:MAG TPA: xanthine dehydrogenase family protein subunit M [Acidimicrobiales bacterium]|nr:xanthine dehydrogenase family protein subunit M [Acidimicrobiales bacterium]